MPAIRSIFSLPFDLALLPQPAYLVGGAVRDFILERSPTSRLDLDIVVERQAIDLARHLSDTLDGGFVILDRDRHIARVVCPTFTLDIAQQAGTTLDEDLKLRDFTCNAIAYELHTNALIDPLEGTNDIRARILRTVHPDNLSADPLRLLRGYRQAAQLGFSLASDTRTAIILRTPLLAPIASERVRTELNYLFDLKLIGLEWLQQAIRDGILQDWLPSISENAFVAARRVITDSGRFLESFPNLAPSLSQILCDNRSALTTTLLAALLASQSSKSVYQTLTRLKYSRAESKWVQKLHGLTPVLQEIAFHGASRSRIYEFFQLADTWFPGIALLAMASGNTERAIKPFVLRYQDPNDALAHQVPFLNGQQLMQALEIGSSPLVGELLAELKLAQAEGTIHSREDAIIKARNLCRDRGLK